MNTDTPLTESQVPASAPERSEKGGSAGLAWLALVLALASLCAAGWTWWQGNSASRDEAVQAADALRGQGQRLADLETRSGQLQAQLAALAAADPGQRLESLEQGLAELGTASRQWQSARDESAAWSRSIQAMVESNQLRLAGLEGRLVALSARSANSSAELDLDEIDYLLRLAQERLQLFADAGHAARALELADAHIAAFDNPLYAGLRQDLSTARQKLAALVVPDARLLNDQLDGLQDSLAELPFKGEKGLAKPAAGPAEEGWWARLRNALSGLVTVRRSAAEENQAPVLADQELIRQGAWLQLELARYALVRRDQQAWDAALQKFSGELQRWFEPGGQGWQEAVALLPELQAVNVAPAMPDISAPLLALRALRHAGAAAPAPAVPAPDPSAALPEAEDSPGAAEAGGGETAE